MSKEYRVVLVNPFISIIVVNNYLHYLLMNILIFQNYAHRHPIILELFSLTPTYYSQNNAGTSGSCLLVINMYVHIATLLLLPTYYH